jgi:hypothetical protein
MGYGIKVGCSLYPQIEIKRILLSELGEGAHSNFPEQAIVLYPHPFQGDHLDLPHEFLCLWIGDTEGNEALNLPADQILDLLYPRLPKAFLPLCLHAGEIFYQGDVGDDGIAIDAGEGKETEKTNQ